MLRPTCMHAEYTGYLCGGAENSPRTDPTLGVVRNAVDKKESASGVSFVIKDGLYVPCGDDAVGRRF